MAKFTVRVELHSASEDDYWQLHGAMQDRGFSRTIRSGNGITYNLPTAEYNFEGSANQDQVLQAAKQAAKTTGRSFGVIVSEAVGRTWEGLTQKS